MVVSINKAVDNVGSKVGDLANNAATDDTTPTLVGTGTAGAIVTISVDGGAAVGSAVVDSSGNWSYTLPTQSEGSHSYTATASNAAGTQGSASFNLTIDTTAPSIPSIGLVSDDVGLVQGPLGNGATDDTTPTLSGTGATPGDVIKVYDGNDVVGSVTVGADGQPELHHPGPGLTEGPHNLSVTATDPVGNESGKSDPFTVNVDLTAPTATASLVSITQDTGSSGSDFVTGDNTLVFNLSTTGTRRQANMYRFHSMAVQPGSMQSKAVATAGAMTTQAIRLPMAATASRPAWWMQAAIPVLRRHK